MAAHRRRVTCRTAGWDLQSVNGPWNYLELCAGWGHSGTCTPFTESLPVGRPPVSLLTLQVGHLNVFSLAYNSL